MRTGAPTLQTTTQRSLWDVPSQGPANATGGGHGHDWERLDRSVQEWMWNQGWTGLREIQSMALEAILDRTDDLLITAETAGGKTEAALLPLVSEVIATRRPVPGFQILYISPLRALINDQLARMRAICDHAHIPVRAWHGNVSQADKMAARRNPQGILLITPE